MARKILHVASPTDGGVPRYVADLVVDQLNRGWSVSVATPAESELADHLAGGPATVVTWKARREPGASVPAETLRLARIIRAVEPDVVHLHASKAGLAGRLAVQGALPTVFQPHSWSFEAVSGAARMAALAWERFAARWTDVLVCVSEAEREIGEEHGIGAEWRVVPNGVDLAAFPESTKADLLEARRRLNLNGAALAVCVGRLCKQKGQDVLLDAWSSVQAKVPGAQLVLVGDGPEERRLERLAGPDIRFVGRRSDVRDWLAAADVVVAPSRWDGMSLAVLEAMACGRSVVATDVAGVREALQESGAIVPVEEPQVLADALVERLRNPARAAAEGRAARRRAELAHDFRRAGDTISELYAELPLAGTAPLVGAPGAAAA